jgi:hypothetical protein
MNLEGIYQKLTIKDVFDNQEQIMEYYFGTVVEAGKKHRYTNPFRTDKTPDCFFKYSRNGILLFYDYATSKVYFNCLDIAQLRTGLTYSQLLEEIFYKIISPHSGQVVSFKHKIVEPTPSIIQCRLCKFDQSDLDYWGQFNISSEILNTFDVRKCCATWINGFQFSANSIGNPTYRYKEKEKIKLYRPLANKKEKFRNNYYGGLLEGWNQLPEKGDVCVITKARKDVMSLYSLGIPSVGVRSETTLISSNAFNLLKGRFKTIITYMDNDKIGIEMNEKISNLFSIPGLSNPSMAPKDPSDWIKLDKQIYSEWVRKEIKLISERSER